MNRLPPGASRRCRWTIPTPAFCLAALLAGAGIVAAQAVPRPETAVPAGQATESTTSARNRDQEKTRLREGTELASQLGSFRLTADRVTFLAKDSDRRFVCLENLNLERIVRAMAENPSQLPWTISGRVTEYQGANYLLIERATQSSGVKGE